MSDQTLDSATDPPPPPPPPSLSRNSSFSKLNAQAPEFVPKRSPTPPPPNDPRLLIVPPPPPSPASMVHAYPPTPVPVPIPVHGPLVSHVLHHHHDQHEPQHHHHHHRQSNRHHNQNQHHQKQEKEKDHGQDVAASSRNNNSKNDNSNVNGLSEEAAQKLINQVEYYFSDVNLATTDHLIRFIFKDPEGFVPISVVSSFKKIKALISSNSQLAAVLRNSTKLVVSEDGKKVKRSHPLTSSDMEELQARIIVAENLPEDHCHQNLMKIFSAVGSVKSIRTCQPQPSNNGGSSAIRSSKTDNVHYTNKVHAFVEYDSVELAEKALAVLNDEDSWRNGLRVRQLLKHGSKDSKPVQGRTKKAGNEGEGNCEEDVSTSEQNQTEKQSEEFSGDPDAQTHEHGEEQSLDKGGQKKSRNRVRGKGRGRGHNNNNHHIHHQNNSRSHVGGPPTINAVNGDHSIGVKQPPPGPRMPDGTRGFSMGRGKPVAITTS